MNKLLGQFLMVSLFLFSFVACTSAEAEGRAESLADCVNPFIGTDFTGNTYPGAQVPFGMVQLSPDNGLPGWDRIAGYFWPDSTIAGFSHTHLSGTGAGDLYDISFMPVTLPYREAKGSLGIHSRFSHDDESASAGYYQVRLADYDINVELTATSRCGVQRYTFPKADAVVFLNLRKAMNWDATQDAHIEQVDSVTLRGYRFSNGWARGQRVFFCTRFSRPFDKMSLDTAAIVSEGKRTGTSVIARLDFKTEEGEQLVVSTALSGVSMEGAMRNLQAEMPDNDFDKCLASARKDWDEQLGKIEIECGNRDEKVKFYTALYHTMMAPYMYQDVDGRYLGMDKKIHHAEPGYTNYSVFSLWDTFRALHPLMTIIQPERAADWGKVLIQGYKEGSILPKWPLASNYTGCMVGYPAVSVLADLVAKGLAEGEDLKTWAEAGARSSVYRADLAEKFKGTRELDLITRHTYYKEKYGFVPADSIPESVSWGLEMAYEDWCISQIAAKAGETELANAYAEKGNYYKRYLDPETKMMRPIMGDGSFRTPFNPRYSAHQKSDYTEGNAFQWSFFVPHDMDNFIAAIGGKQELETRLDTLFTTSSQIDGAEASGDITGLIGQYAHGNEPSHHMAYLYNWTDAPWKGQERLDQIMKDFYTNKPDGIIGNEDCGQMSAWYVMSALGFYQVCPGIPVYALGRPMVTHAKLPVEGGTFEIIVKNNSAENKYLVEATLNGTKLSTPFIQHSDIVKGGTLVLTMSNQKPAVQTGH